MGNTQGTEEHPELRRASSRFDDCEIRVIKETFKDLCHLSGEKKRIDKETFLQYFPLPGLLGERLFAVFDKKNIGEVDYEEFICGLAVTCKGTWEEKIEFIFRLYDLHNAGAVSKEELAALLNHIPKNVMKLGQALQGQYQGSRLPFPVFDSCSRHNYETNQFMYSLNLNMSGDTGTNHVTSDGSAEHDRTDEELSHEGDDSHRSGHTSEHPYHHHYVDFTNADIVEKAFEVCDLDHDGKLSFNEFRLWMERNPHVAYFLQSVFPYDEYRNWEGDTKHLPFIHNRDLASVSSKSPEMSPRNSDRFESASEEAIRLLRRVKMLTGNMDIQSKIDEAMDLFHQEATLSRNEPSKSKAGGDANKMDQHIISQARSFSPRTAQALNHQTVIKKGMLSKKGLRLKSWKRRWYVLVGNCIYYYQQENDRTPRGVIFLLGSFVEPIYDDENEKKQHWGFEISRPQEHGLKRHLYADSRLEREKWVHELRRASKVIPIEEDFEIGPELGKGQFSRVCQCINKRTMEKKAVKIIEKDTMDAEEKELLRAEIAIMKLVNHPNIIRMEAVYESRQHIFIVMELHSGGELFDRVNGRPRLSEDEAFCVIYPLVESVAYLHEMGIVHRDLKPENILCGERIGDIKIADFGLSKIVLPHEIMKMPCGTLSYVAPEVLTLNGYGKEADMWSVGTIMYLLLRGRLPFDIDGESREKIIQSTINGAIDTDDHVWKSLSEDSRSLMLGLLNKDIKRRMSAKEALLHPWITSRVDRMQIEPQAFNF